MLSHVAAHFIRRIAVGPCAIVVPVVVNALHADLREHEALIGVQIIDPLEHLLRFGAGGGNGERAARQFPGEVTIHLLAAINKRIQRHIFLHHIAGNYIAGRQSKQHAVHRRIAAGRGGRTGFRIQQPQRRPAVRIQQILVPQQLQPFQEGAEFIRRQHFADYAILLRQIIIIGVDAKGMRQEAQIPHAGEGHGNFVIRLAVLVHVPVAEEAQHVRQLLRRRRHVHLQAFQPRFVDPHGVAHAQLIDGRKRHNRAVRQGNRFQPVRMFLKQRINMRRIFFQVGAQINQLPGLIKRHSFLRGQFRLEQHVRHGHFTGQHGLFHLCPGGCVRIFADGEYHTRFFFHHLKELIRIPVMQRIFRSTALGRFQAGKHKGRFRGRSKRHE